MFLYTILYVFEILLNRLDLRPKDKQKLNGSECNLNNRRTMKPEGKIDRYPLMSTFPPIYSLAAT